MDHDRRKQIFDAVLAEKEQIVSDRRYLHQHPEIGFDTGNTEKMVRDVLSESCIEVIPSTVGVMGIIKSGKSDDILALRADMDALPLQEENDVPYKSQYDNRMHACGHDGHTAMLLGAARILQQYRELLPVNVLLIFQPAEEGPDLGGARIMLKDLEESGMKSKIRKILGIHLFNDFQTGTAGYRYGAMMASTDEFDIKITGKGGHAAQPHEAVDALSLGCKFVDEMESFMSRRIDPLKPAVFSVGSFNAGTAKNIISENAVISGTVRCLYEDTRASILEAASKILESICGAYGAEYKLDILNGLPVLVNDRSTAAFAKNVIGIALGGENAFEITEPIMGSEDFAYFAQKIPAAFIWLGSGNEEKGFTTLAHNPRFDFDEDALINGVRIFCMAALEA